MIYESRVRLSMGKFIIRSYRDSETKENVGEQKRKQRGGNDDQISRSPLLKIDSERTSVSR